MKKHHPDEDAIPTLNDLVFPGERELRRPQQQHERIDPQLPSEATASESESEAYDREETASEPFILLPDEEDTLAGWEFPSRTPSGRHATDEPAPHLEEPGLPPLALESEDALDQADDSEQPSIEDSLQNSGQDTDVEQNTPAETALSQSNATSTQAVTDDLPPVSSTSQQPPDIRDETLFEPAEQASPPAPETLSPAPDYELVRAAVRNVLESELDRLTDVVTDAVIRRLRE